MHNTSIIKQHITDAASLWWRRSSDIVDGRIAFSQLWEQDRQIDAHLDGVFEAGGNGWDACCRALRWSRERRSPDARADAFVLMAVALASPNEDRLSEALDLCTGMADYDAAVGAALSWTEPDQLRLLLSHSDCATALREAIARHPAVYALVEGQGLEAGALRGPRGAAALNAAADCGRIDLLDGVLAILVQEKQPTALQFSAARAAALLGERHLSLKALKAHVFDMSTHAAHAMQLLCLMLPSLELQALLAQVDRDGHHLLLIRAAGWSGDAHYVPWLLDRMNEPPLAADAGEAFRQITGFDIEQNGATLAAPATRKAYPTPDAAQLSAWWQDSRQGYASGGRYFLGDVPDLAWLLRLLAGAEQAHRDIAALYLALMHPRTPLLPTRVRSLFQARQLTSYQEQLHA